MENFLISLAIMGMLGIFIVIIAISLIVALLGKLGSSKKEDEEKTN